MITERQRQVRNQGVGASECAAVLGLDPYRSAYDLWVFKTEKHEETGRAEENEAQRIGNLIEPTTAALAEQRLGVRLVKPTATYKAANGVMFANLDRQVGESRRGADNCELKSTALLDGWGEEGTDEVPERVLIQVHAQMLCSDASLSHVARLLGRYGFQFSMYRVVRNESLMRVIEDKVCDFWHKHVEKDIPPTGSIPSVGVMSHVRREAGKTVTIAADVVRAYMAARDALKAAEKEEEHAKALLLAALGDAEAGSADGLSVSFKAVSTTRLDTEALRSAHPDLFTAFAKASTYRRLDVRETAQGRKGSVR